MSVTPQSVGKIEGDEPRVAAALDVDALRANGALDRIAEAAATVCDVPMAHVSIVAPKSQKVVGHRGLSYESLPRQRAFCVTGIAEGGVLIAEDVRDDERFKAGSFREFDDEIRLYAGLPLLVDGVAIGTLSLFDTEARRFDQVRRAALFGLVHQLESHLSIHRACGEADDARETLSTHITSMVAQAAKLRWHAEIDEETRELLDSLDREIEEARRVLETMFDEEDVCEEPTDDRLKQLSREGTRVDRSSLGFVDTEVDEA